MADIKPVIVPLNGKNYPTWKIQCRMALVKDNLWSIVSETEECPTEREPRRKFIERCDKALAIIVLMIDPKLIYLLGADPTDPVVVWKRLEEQFQRKTWATTFTSKIIFTKAQRRWLYESTYQGTYRNF